MALILFMVKGSGHPFTVRDRQLTFPSEERETYLFSITQTL